MIKKKYNILFMLFIKKYFIVGQNASISQLSNKYNFYFKLKKIFI